MTTQAPAGPEWQLRLDRALHNESTGSQHSDSLGSATGDWRFPRFCAQVIDTAGEKRFTRRSLKPENGNKVIS
jgi:hypothetical protein